MYLDGKHVADITSRRSTAALQSLPVCSVARYRKRKNAFDGSNDHSEKIYKAKCSYYRCVLAYLKFLSVLCVYDLNRLNCIRISWKNGVEAGALVIEFVDWATSANFLATFYRVAFCI